VKPLDESAIKAIRGCVRGKGPLCLYEQTAEAVVTDGSFILAWEYNNTDRNCNGYKALRRAQKEPGAERLGELRTKLWQDWLLGSSGEVVRGLEMEPTKQEIFLMKDGSFYVYTANGGKRRYYYDWRLIGVAEYFVPTPFYHIFIPPKKDERDIYGPYGPLLIYEKGALRGALMNSLR
jgi:hypothetical protein